MRQTLRELRLLLWKNFTLKRRQPIVVAVEVLWPLVLVIIEVVIRQENPPRNDVTRIYAPRALPSAGLLPFLQSAVCDPEAIGVVHNHKWNDTYGFYDRNPALSSLIGNMTLMLQDPKIKLSNLLRLSDDIQHFRDDQELLNQTLQRYGRSWQARNIQLRQLVRNSSELRTFLVHQLNFSSSDASEFLNSSIDVYELQMFLLDQTAEFSQCMVWELSRCIQTLRNVQNYFGAQQSISRGSSKGDATEAIGRTEQFLFNPVKLQLLVCNQSEWYSKIFFSSSPKAEARLHNRLCHLTASQIEALSEELEKQLNVTKFWQVSTLESNSTVTSQIVEDATRLREDYETVLQVGNYLQKPLQELLQTMPSSILSSHYNTTFDMYGLMQCILCKHRCHTLGESDGNEKSKSRKEASTFTDRLRKGITLLYAPNSQSVKDVITEANRTIAGLDKMKQLAAVMLEWISASDWINASVQAQSSVSKMGGSLASTAGDVCEELQTLTQTVGSDNAAALLAPITSVCALQRLAKAAMGNLKTVDEFKVNWIGFLDEASLEEYNTLASLNGSVVWAGVVFRNLKNGTSLDKDIRYTLRMNETLVRPPTQLTSRYWSPGPGAYRGSTMYEVFGFLYIQDLVDRAIISVVANTTVIEPGGYMQRFPYPCYITDRFAVALSGSLPLFMALAWVFSFSMVVRNVVYEKEERLREMMKIMGLPGLSLWLSWFITSFVIMGSSALILTILMTVGGILRHSNFLIVLLFMFNYTTATIMLCFLISTFFNKANLAALCGGLLYMFTYLPFIVYITHETDYSFSQTAGLSLLSTTAFGVGCNYVARLEDWGLGLQWDTIGMSVMPGDQFSFLAANLFIALDTLIYAILVWYIDNIFPGQYGIPRPWYFPFQRSYWTNYSNQQSTATCNGYTTVPIAQQQKENRTSASSTPRCEDEPSHLRLGASVHNLVKVYGGKKRAVDDLTLNFYEGQITSFLGHNGAGKTTTMSILCGLFPPTSGEVHVQGMNVASKINEIRKILGLCPQQNVLYNKLTVAEHLWFFAKIKNVNVPDKDLKAETVRWLDDLNLTSKRNAKVGSLSGGMKRKLSVAMAYVGGSKVVLLDEPTAGVDPYARRGIWDLMMKHREDRTVILSTHYMDEADVLGDRIAIISNGKLCCAGSSLFLKRQFSDGYFLTLAKQELVSESSLAFNKHSDLNESGHRTAVERAAVYSSALSSSLPMLSASSGSSPLADRSIPATIAKNSNHQRNKSEGNDEAFAQFLGKRQKSRSLCSTDKVTALIRSHIPDVQLLEDVGSELSYRLPACNVTGNKLSQLLCQLESQKSDLSIASYGISDTSLEDVFLKVTNDNEDTQTDHTTGLSLVQRFYCKQKKWRKKEKPDSRVPLIGSSDGQCNSGSEDSGDECNERMEAVEPETEPGIEESCDADRNGGGGTCNMTGKSLLWQQFKATFIKRFHNSRRYRRGFIAQIILPAAFICIALVFKRLAPGVVNKSIELTPSLYPGEQFIPYVNFQPWQGQAANLTEVFAQPCGVSAHFLIEHFNDTGCQHDMSTFSHKQPSYSFPHESNVSSTKLKCSCATGKQECPANIVAPSPPSLHTADRLTLQDLVEKANMSDYILKSTDDFILHRYGGVSFGNENPQFENVSPGLYQDILQLVGVRKAAKAWYTNNGFHAPPIYLNVLNNAILRASVDRDRNISQYGITTYLHPFNKTVIQQVEENMQSGIDLLIALCVIFALSFVPPSFVMFLIRERATGAKHQQLVCGVHPVIYWTANFCWDMCNYMVTVICVVIIFYAFNEAVYTSGDNFTALVALFILHGWAMIPLMYPATFVFKNSSSAYVVLMGSSVLIGFVTTSATLVLQLTEQQDNGLTATHGVSSHLRAGFLIFPNYCLGRGLMDIAYDYYISVANDALKDFGLSARYVRPLSFSVEGVGRNLVVMTIEGILLFVLVLLIEYKFFVPSLWSRGAAGFVSHKRDEDKDVAKERRRILQGRASESVLRLENLTKVYQSCFSTSKLLAVDGLSLGVSRGECFGLLGVNGAGKTTTFKMLTGDISVSQGNAFVLDSSVVSDIHSVRHSVGYCPQFDAINDLLTGREHLMLYARLKGITEKAIPKVVDWCLQRLALISYAEVMAGKYSGGNKRKLSTAIALIGQPTVILLDEPTTGMDPKSKRYFWSVINGLVQQGRSVILTSHSMEECEALCTRIGIMVNGRLQCLGSPLHLKNRFGDGYTVTIRIAGSNPNLNPVKFFFSTTFQGSALKEEHHNMLEYQLPSHCAPLHCVFSLLERNKLQLEIEDYSVSQTTLDRVFLHFAKEQSDNTSVHHTTRKMPSRQFKVRFSAHRQEVHIEDQDMVRLTDEELPSHSTAV